MVRHHATGRDLENLGRRPIHHLYLIRWNEYYINTQAPGRFSRRLGPDIAPGLSITGFEAVGKHVWTWRVGGSQPRCEVDCPGAGHDDTVAASGSCSRRPTRISPPVALQSQGGGPAVIYTADETIPYCAGIDALLDE